MVYNPEKHHRRSIRLRGYDYSQPGWYFVTICTHHRLILFGKIIGGKMRLNDFGKIAESEWKNTQSIRSNIQLDEFIIMPNHLHGVIGIINHGGAYGDTPQQSTFKSPSQNIGAIIRGFKSAATATKQINQLRKSLGTPAWQRNYYEHIIRDEKDLTRIRKYIINNPGKWQDDKYYN